MGPLLVRRPRTIRPGVRSPHELENRLGMSEIEAGLAAVLAELPLRGIRREYPNLILHVLNGPEDVRSPRELHPAFYGCLDWHSAVHSHWTLVRLLKTARLANADEIRNALAENLTAENLRREADYFLASNRRSFERPYGWAWLLKLALELRTWNEGSEWADNLRPLEEVIVAGYLDFLPRQTYPVRVGTHANTAFGLMFALEYADRFNPALAAMIRSRAIDYYSEDRDYPTQIEPSGADFLSPSLIEADLMRRVLGERFAEWFERFLPNLAHRGNLLEPVIVSDRSDPQIAHLDGLNLSRAWCFREISRFLPPDHQWQECLRDAADRHAGAGLANVASGHYEGEHWLASFAVHLLSV
jgi:hypothetical protein